MTTGARARAPHRSHSGAPAFSAHVVRDGRLVTGQNPASAAGVAEAVLEALADR